ncbi:STAS domain-containing protein [Paenibacillus koleovorans]|uniref:STAS domain-containing protein n=1 Tax=Paenibacillus koleovorans TaxID=121608 RepID=UPI000FDC6B20|nr:STAS domain-containing protein [Paenibacillus koleovorans]
MKGNANKTFRITKQTTDSATIVLLGGELDLSAATDLAEELQPLLAQRERSLILNMRELSYIDSTGIGILVSVLKARGAANAPFAVEDVPPRIQRLFDLTGITKHLASSISLDHSMAEGNERIG